jgi:hypothetical protein
MKGFENDGMELQVMKPRLFNIDLDLLLWACT